MALHPPDRSLLTLCQICRQEVDFDLEEYFLANKRWPIHRNCLILFELSERTVIYKYLSYKSPKYCDFPNFPKYFS